LGEATFYLKAEFPDEEAAEKALGVIKEILQDVADCWEEWQEIRDELDKSVKERHERLMSNHPLAARFLRLPEPDESDEFMNYLAGYLEITHDFELFRKGNVLFLYDTVWHLGSWDNIAELFAKFGAKRVGWISDEWIDLASMIFSVIRMKPSRVDGGEVEKNFEEALMMILYKETCAR